MAFNGVAYLAAYEAYILVIIVYEEQIEWTHAISLM